MIGLIVAIHIIVCALLVTVILIQSGRGGGLIESFSGVESMFGTKTNAFLTRTTTILATSFFITCLSLALLSVRQSRSLMRNIKPTEDINQAAQSVPEASKPEASKQEAPKPSDASIKETPAKDAPKTQ